MKGHYMTFRCRLCGKTFTNGGTGDEWTARKAMGLSHRQNLKTNRLCMKRIAAKMVVLASRTFSA